MCPQIRPHPSPSGIFNLKKSFLIPIIFSGTTTTAVPVPKISKIRPSCRRASSSPTVICLSVTLCNIFLPLESTGSFLRSSRTVFLVIPGRIDPSNDGVMTSIYFFFSLRSKKNYFVIRVLNNEHHIATVDF
jgi:hypothetical protein